MNYDELVVKYGGLDNMANEVITKAKNLDNIIETIDGKMKSTASSWEGESAKTYQDVQRQWAADAGQLKGALQEIARMIQSAAQNYHAGDLKAASFYQL
jgi:WXG100 family type VII secretion target